MTRQRMLIALIGFWFLCAYALGQGSTGTIVGTVKDSSGAVVPAATVTVRNEGTNVARNLVTSGKGDYTVPLLPPGSYTVSVSHTGFVPTAYNHITLQVDQTARVDVTLKVGAVTQQVEVTGAAPLVQTDTSSLGQVVSQAQITNLPLNQRNFVQFAYLTPGVQVDAQGSLESTQGLALSANGVRTTSNNFTVDGIDDNDLVINQYAAVPSVDAIQEFKVQTGVYSAEYGRSAGAQVNVVLKSGTNQLHGDLFEYLRNRHMDSKNYFDLPNCTPGAPLGSCDSIPRLDRSQFGGSLGGPIQKDKTFFFGTFEYLDQFEASTRIATVPSQAQIAQALIDVPSGNRNQAGVNILNLYPAANIGANLTTSNQYQSAPVSTMKEPYAVAKMDHYFGSSDTLSIDYVMSWGDAGNAFDPLSPYTNLPGYGTTVRTHGQNLGIHWTHIFNARTLNEFRVGANGEHGIFLQTLNTDENTALGFPDVLTAPIDLGFPNVSTTGFDGIGQPTNTPQDHPTWTTEMGDDLALFQGGKNQVKVGFDFSHYWYKLLFDTSARGVWAFQGNYGPAACGTNTSQCAIDQLLLGIPSTATSVNSEVNMHLYENSPRLYINDNYQVMPNLTLNLGLRWEFNSPVTEGNNQLSAPNFDPADAACSPKPGCLFIVAGTDGLPAATYKPDYHDWAPRLGFAWRPTGSDHLVLRGGYGIFYDILLLNAQLESRLNPPFRITSNIVNDGTATIQNIFNRPASVTPPSGTYMDLNWVDPYTEEYQLDAQWEPFNNWLLDVGYVGSRGIHLATNEHVNQPQPGQPIPYPQFNAGLTMLGNEGDSYYNALQTKVQKRMANGLNLVVAYTWSRCLDDTEFFGGNEGGTTVQNPQDVRADMGLCGFNTSQLLVTNWVYDLPFGPGKTFANSGIASHLLGHWETSAILTLQGGHPFTVTRGVPQSNTIPGSSAGDRPNQVGDPFVAGTISANPTCAAPTAIGTTAAWFNTCAFQAAPNAFGDEGKDGLLGPTYKNLDFSLMRNFPIGSEARYLQFEAQFFNLTNTPHFDLPNHNFDSATFGQIQSANAYGNLPPRQIQLGLRFVF